MAEPAAERTLLAKKFGGIFLVIIGCLLTAAGVELSLTGLTLLGLMFVIVGVILWVYKIAEPATQGALLAKKFGGILLIIVGCLLTAAGVELSSTGVTVLGGLFVISGVILWVIKVARRNRSSQVG